MGELASLFGGGGGGSLSPSSDTAQSSPFYNESGIYFNSAGAGVLNGGDSSASAIPPALTRQLTGGLAPQSTSSLPLDFSSATGSTSLLPYIIGALIVLVLSVFLLFKK